jgi:heptosyltransferase II
MDLKRVLVRLPGTKFGDFLMTTPALAGLKNQFPGIYIAVLHSGTALPPWLQDHPLFDEAILDHRPRKISGMDGLLPLVKTLKSHRFDASVMLQPRERYLWAFKLAGIPCRVGTVDSAAKALLTHNVPVNRDQPDRHEVEYNYDLMRALGIQGSPGPMVLQTSSIAIERAAELLSTIDNAGKPLIALTPGYGGSSRRLPPELFIGAASQLIKTHNAFVVVLGTSEEAENNAGIAHALASSSLNLTGKTDIKTLGEVLKRCRLHISIDTGTSHAAAAVGTPCVTVMSCMEHWDQRVRWSPWKTETRLLGPAQHCSGCKMYSCHRNSEACLQSITPEAIASAAVSLLEQSN